MQTVDKREQIVRTAYDLFNRHGYRAVGIDRIIAEAGVAKMTMYRHFPSKDDLVVAVLVSRFDRFERLLDDLAARSPTPRDELAGILRWYRDWFHSADFRGCVFVRALGEYDDPDRVVFPAAAAQKIALRVRLERIATRLGHPPAEAALLGAALTAAFEGATVLARTETPDSAASALELTADRLLRRPTADR